MKSSIRISSVVLGLALSATLVSCSSGETFSEAESTPLPAEGVELYGAPTDDAVSLLGSDDAGHTFYAGRWEIKDVSSFCLVMEAKDGFERACGETLPITATFSSVRAILDPVAHGRTLSGAQALVGDHLIVEER